MSKLQNIEKVSKPKENNQLTYKKIEVQLDLLVKGQKINQKELRLGFIGLAKQSIGHRTLDTTSAYVDKLSDQERQERMSELDSLSEALKISLKGP
jgi:hypothetical protein